MMKKALQIAVQVLFLVLFIMLLITGKIQIWIGIFIISVILALFFGRFYCGWLCPINTVVKRISDIKSKLKLKGFNTPEFIKKPVFRYGMLIAFVLTFIFVMASGKKLPVLPALFIAGAALTVFFPENLWHRYLCPYGTILSLTGSLAMKHMKIDESQCIECGMCQKVCPADAVTKLDRYSINKGSCLVCLECAYQCPKSAIYLKMKEMQK